MIITYDEAVRLHDAVLAATAGLPSPEAQIAARLVEATRPMPDVPDDGRPPILVVLHTEVTPGGADYQEEIEKIPRALWEAMSPAQREAYVAEMLAESVAQRCGSGWHLAGDDAGSPDDPGGDA